MQSGKVTIQVPPHNLTKNNWKCGVKGLNDKAQQLQHAGTMGSQMVVSRGFLLSLNEPKEKGFSILQGYKWHKTYMYHKEACFVTWMGILLNFRSELT